MNGGGQLRFRNLLGEQDVVDIPEIVTFLTCSVVCSPNVINNKLEEGIRQLR